MLQAKWKITFPIQKADFRADGVYIVGEASGPEVDAHDERMSPEAIELFAQQINSQADFVALNFLDAHAQDGVLRELGTVTRAWIDPTFHLGIEVRLDMDNPASVFLAKQLGKGKQYGMSIGGMIVRFADQWVEEVGRVIRTYQEIVLSEISITTRPAWTPSFGTVLSKSIDEARDAESVAEGDSVLKKDELQRDDTNDAPEAPAAEAPEAPAVEAAADEAEAPAEAEKSCKCPEGCEDCKGAECACEHEPAAEAPAADAEAPAEDNAEEPAAEAAPAAESAEVENSAALPAELLKALTPYIDAAVAKALSGTAPQEPVSQDEAAVEKSTDDQPTLESVMTELGATKKALEEATARIKELEETPASAPPAAKSSGEGEESFEDLLKALSPRERIRLGLAGAIGR